MKKIYISKKIKKEDKNFLHFLDNDDRMSPKRRDLSALVFLINEISFNTEIGEKQGRGR